MECSDATNEELMHQLQAGNDLALDVLMEQWEKPLVAFTMRYTGNSTDAIDLAQETFVRVYMDRFRFRRKGKFFTWVFAIAASLCRNHSRRRLRHPFESARSQTAESHENADPDEHMDGGLMLHGEAERVQEAVQALPHDLKTALLLFVFEGASHADIAEVSGCSAKAIKKRLCRARRLVEDQLKYSG